jgi:Fe-S oxidoreductase
VFLEPSCFAVFRDESLALFPGRRESIALARNAVLFTDFIRPYFDRGSLPPIGRKALVHVHCHQRALAGTESTTAACRGATLDATVLDAGCCGMAGSFGFDQDHYDVSLAVGERLLLPEIRSAPADTLVIADGFSCRQQIQHGTGRRARHFAEVVRAAISSPNTLPTHSR